MRRLYLAGPMTGLPDYNYPAFHAAAARLRSAGYDVASPAELGKERGYAWHDYLRRGLIQMLRDCTGVALLPGWNESKGARVEVDVAAAVGMRLWSVGQWIAAATGEDRPGYTGTALRHDEARP